MSFAKTMSLTALGGVSVVGTVVAAAASQPLPLVISTGVFSALSLIAGFRENERDICKREKDIFGDSLDKPLANDLHPRNSRAAVDAAMMITVTRLPTPFL